MIVSTPPGTAQLTAGRGPVKETEYSVLRPESLARRLITGTVWVALCRRRLSATTSLTPRGKKVEEG